MNELTHLDLFSGIGGFSLGLEAAGFRTIGFAEIDPYAGAVLKRHWPHVQNYGDIRNVPALRCDIITGGFPCQPFSSLGKRGGKSDDRFLWPTMLDVIDRCQPTWVCGENVADFENVALTQMLADLEGKGFRVQPFIIPASCIGAVHERKRIWCLAWNANRSDGPKVKEFPATRRAQKHSSRMVQKTWWESVPEVGRMADGIPNKSHRYRVTGNAIVPQIAQIIGQAINQIERGINE
jgi:DNA (cytosine-5)-methyltransferase 1